MDSYFQISVATLSQITGFTVECLLQNLLNSWHRVDSLEILSLLVADATAMEISLFPESKIPSTFEAMEQHQEIISYFCHSKQEETTELVCKFYLSMLDLCLLTLEIGLNFKVKNGTNFMVLWSELLQKGTNPITMVTDERLLALIRQNKYSIHTSNHLAAQQFNAWTVDSLVSAMQHLTEKYSSKLKNETFQVSETYTTEELFGELKRLNPASKLNFDDIMDNVIAVKENRKNSSKLVKVVGRLNDIVKQVYGYYPRDHQLFVLFAACEERKRGNVIFQVDTGEGKSLIVLLLSALEKLYFDRNTDVLTSQSLLAQRDATSSENIKFYSSSNLQCTYIPEFSVKHDELISRFKNNDVCFGTAHSFESGLLGVASSDGELVKGYPYCEQHARSLSNRSFSKSTAIIDECDHILDDNIMGSTLLSAPTPGFRDLRFFWLTITSAVSTAIADMGLPFEVKNQLFVANKSQSFLTILADLLKCKVSQDDNLVDKISMVLAPMATAALIVPGFITHFGFTTCKSEQDAAKVIASMPVEKLIEFLAHKRILSISVALFGRLNDDNLETEPLGYFSPTLCHKTIPAGVEPEKIDFVLVLGQSQRSSVSTCLQVANLVENAKDKICSAITTKFLENPDQLNSSVPDFEKSFFTKNLRIFVDNAWDVLCYYQHQSQYEIIEGQIKFIDSATGVTQMNMVYSDGVHQYLEAKHGLNLSIFGLSGNVVTNLTLIRHYPLFIGLTGSVGNENEIKYKKDKFNAEVVIVPPYAKKQVILYPDVICKNQHEWVQQIIMDTKVKILKNRVVLIICKTQSIAHAIKKEITQSLQATTVEYIESEVHKENVMKQFKPRTVVISTNLGGRGTDLKLHDDAIQNGGLHVILTFYPDSPRSEKQNIGRSGRQGQPGSAVKILNQSSDSYGLPTSVYMKFVRDEQVKQRMERLGARVQEQIELAKYYGRYTSFVETLRNICSLTRETLDQINYKWSITFFNISHTDNDSERCRLFSEFCANAKKSLKNDGQHICFNPYIHVNQIYQSEISLSSRYAIAERALDQMKDLQFACDLGKLLYSASDNESWPNKKKRALKALGNCLSRLDNYKKQFEDLTKHFLKLLILVGGSNYEKYVKEDIGTESDMINALKASLEQGKEVLTKNEKFSVELLRWKDMTDINDNSKPLRYWRSCGIYGGVKIEKITSFWDRVLGFLAAAFGVAMLIGAFFAVSIPIVGWFIAGAMTTLGVKSIVRGVKGMVTGQFDLEEFLTKDILGTLEYVCTVGLTESWEEFFGNLLTMVPGLGAIGSILKAVIPMIESANDFFVALCSGDWVGMLKNGIKIMGSIAKHYLGAALNEFVSIVEKTASGAIFLGLLAKRKFIEALDCISDIVPDSLKQSVKKLVAYAKPILIFLHATVSGISSPIAFLESFIDLASSYNIPIPAVVREQTSRISKIYTGIRTNEVSPVFEGVLGTEVWGNIQNSIPREAAQLVSDCQEDIKCNRIYQLCQKIAAFLQNFPNCTTFDISSTNQYLNYVIRIADVCQGGFSLGTVLELIQVFLPDLIKLLPTKLRTAIDGAYGIYTAIREGNIKEIIMKAVEWVAGNTVGSFQLGIPPVLESFISDVSFSFPGGDFKVNKLQESIQSAKGELSSMQMNMFEACQVDTGKISNLLPKASSMSKFEFLKEAGLALLAEHNIESIGLDLENPVALNSIGTLSTALGPSMDYIVEKIGENFKEFEPKFEVALHTQNLYEKNVETQFQQLKAVNQLTDLIFSKKELLKQSIGASLDITTLQIIIVSFREHPKSVSRAIKQLEKQLYSSVQLDDTDPIQMVNKVCDALLKQSNDLSWVQKMQGKPKSFESIFQLKTLGNTQEKEALIRQIKEATMENLAKQILSHISNSLSRKIPKEIIKEPHQVMQNIKNANLRSKFASTLIQQYCSTLAIHLLQLLSDDHVDFITFIHIHGSSMTKCCPIPFNFDLKNIKHLKLDVFMKKCFVDEILKPCLGDIDTASWEFDSTKFENTSWSKSLLLSTKDNPNLSIPQLRYDALVALVKECFFGDSYGQFSKQLEVLSCAQLDLQKELEQNQLLIDNHFKLVKEQFELSNQAGTVIMKQFKNLSADEQLLFASCFLFGLYDLDNLNVKIIFQDLFKNEVRIHQMITLIDTNNWIPDVKNFSHQNIPFSEWLDPLRAKFAESQTEERIELGLQLAVDFFCNKLREFFLSTWTAQQLTF